MYIIVVNIVLIIQSMMLNCKIINKRIIINIQFQRIAFVIRGKSLLAKNLVRSGFSDTYHQLPDTLN